MELYHPDESMSDEIPKGDVMNAKELLNLDRELTTEEIQQIRVELGMKPQSDVVELTTHGDTISEDDRKGQTHWDEIERLK